MAKKRETFKVKKWSKDEDDTLREMYNNPHLKVKDIEILLNRSESSIANRAYILKLKKVTFKSMEVEEGKKVCRRCGQIKSTEEFYKHKSLKDGLNSWCKLCSRESNNRYLLKQAEKTIKKDLLDKEQFIKDCENKLFVCTSCKKELDIKNFNVIKKYNKYTKESRCKVCKVKANSEYKYKKIQRLGHI